jgi:hypothetical protein
LVCQAGSCSVVTRRSSGRMVHVHGHQTSRRSRYMWALSLRYLILLVLSESQIHATEGQSACRWGSWHWLLFDCYGVFHLFFTVCSNNSDLLPPCLPGFEPASGGAGSVVDEAALGGVFSVYFGFPCQAFHQLL